MHRFARWQPLLNGASTEAEVIRIMNDYLATLQPEQLESLPADCRIGRLSTAQEVELAAVTLAHSDLKADPTLPASKLLTEMAHTFAWAQARTRDLRTRWPIPATGDS